MASTTSKTTSKNTSKKQTSMTQTRARKGATTTKVSARTLARDSAYATVGLTDTAVAFVRTLPTKVEQLRTDLPQVVKGLGDEAPKNLTVQLSSLRDRAEDELTSLAERGRTIVEALQRNAKPADALEQVRRARSQMRAATGDLRRAVSAGRGVVGEAAGTAGAAVRAASRASQRRQYEAMTTEELRDLASRRDISGRSELTKSELITALLKA